MVKQNIEQDCMVILDMSQDLRVLELDVGCPRGVD